MTKKNGNPQASSETVKETKSFLASKTIQGIAITALAGIFPAVGLIPESLIAQIIDGLFLAGGAAYAAYGRFKAETAIA